MIKLEDVSYFYKQNSAEQNTALDKVSLEIKEGEFIGIAGHTGSGKTTLAQIIAGLILPSDGKITIDGAEYPSYKEAAKALRSKVGIVFQYPEHQLFEETVYRDIAFGPKNKGLSDEETDKCVRESAKLSHLDESLFEKSPFELSGGQKRRVAIAGVLAMKPSVLILDEPAAGLDPSGRKQLLSELRQIHKNSDTSLVLISHSMEDLAENADRIVLLKNGRKIKDDNTRNVFADYEALKKCGLDMPEITKVIRILRENGFDLPSDIFTVDEACEYIARTLGVNE